MINIDKLNEDIQRPDAESYVRSTYGPVYGDLSPAQERYALHEMRSRGMDMGVVAAVLDTDLTDAANRVKASGAPEPQYLLLLGGGYRSILRQAKKQGRPMGADPFRLVDELNRVHRRLQAIQEQYGSGQFSPEHTQKVRDIFRDIETVWKSTGFSEGVDGEL